MPALVTWLGWIAAGLGAAGALYALIASVLVRRFLGRPAPPAIAAWPAASLIKPLHGDEPDLHRNLESFCRQDYPAPVQMLCGIQTPGDPAGDAVRALQAAWPEREIELVYDARTHGENRKISNVVNIAAHARREVLVLSDSDIAVGPDYLRQVIAALDAPGVGAVSCLYVGKAGAGIWSRLEAMIISYRFLPDAALGGALGLEAPCCGSTIALKAETLDALGGFHAFADKLADDYEIGRAVRSRGLTVALPPLTVTHVCAAASAGEFFGREVRSGVTVRLINPWGYAGSLVTHATPLALIGLLLTGGAPFAVGALGFALAARAFLQLAVDGATGTKTGPGWLLPALDVLSFLVFLTSFTADSVSWRGRRLRVSADGLLTRP